jgi:GNAT superfamily N-acetyltransferase
VTVATFRETPVTNAAVLALLAEYFAFRAETFPRGPGEYRTTFPAAAQFAAPHGVFLVVEDSAGDIGCGGIRALTATRFEVKHLWMQPRGRARGLGRALLTELERRAATLGATELVLDTNASLTTAGALYRSRGYREIDAYNDNPNATTWYRKSLE